MNWTDLNLSSLKTFVDVIELGSLTKAAERNHVSRPAVSQAIRRIEEIIGFELIEHTKNNLLLTEEGRRFFHKAKESLKLFSDALLSPTQSSTLIDVGCSSTLAEHLVLPTLAKLKHENKIQISIGTTARIRQRVIDGDTRLGIVIDDGKTVDLETLSLGAGRFQLYSKSGRFTGPIITTEPRNEVSKLRSTLAKSRQSAVRHIEIESWSLCRKAAELLGGTCLIPDLIKTEGLKLVREPKLLVEYEIKALFRDANLLSEAEYELLTALQK